MANFINTKSVSSSIDKIINEAKDELFIVSPYLKVSNYYLDRLVLASNRGVHITFVYGKTGYDKNVIEELSKLKNVTVAFREPLHAKCYFNEKTMVISSMNLHEFSENNNDEIGVLISSVTDSKLYKEARTEVAGYLELSEIQSDTYSKQDVKVKKPDLNCYCIRCSAEIKENLNRPYCDSCWSSWSYWGNPDFAEKVCHNCGCDYQSTKNSPLCDRCNQKSNKRRYGL
jgi:phosphatidylserine/phosphatidylglycerophosphate/cardiolipin synthase-like enzyme